MAKKKSKNTKSNNSTFKRAGIRFDPTSYVEIHADLEDFSNSTITSEIGETTTEYRLDGGGSITTMPLDVTENGTYTAPQGSAYSPVEVMVPRYKEELLWTNPNPGSGFNTDMILGDFIPTGYDYYKITYRYINNKEELGAVIFNFRDLAVYNQGVALCSLNESFEAFARAIVFGAIEISSDPPMYEERLIARGLCSQIGVVNEKKFRCIPYQVYGVSFSAI